MGARIGPVSLVWADAGAARSATGRALLAGLIAELAPGADPAVSRECPRCGATDHGRPRADDAPVAVSVSYAGGVVVAAAARSEHVSALGVDAEPERDGPLAELAPLFAPATPPDVRGWTMIEAVVKADGRGLRVAPGEVRFRAPRTATRLPGARIAALPDACGTFEVAPAPAPPGMAVSVAIRRARPR
ncbi:hypothetical protein [Microbacterium karelineae]|uniref:hypothetical protein n=1 Tax=Microbacterium karelineae TaxID=2654283 RepID=UPI0012EA42FC|nr:hypothetical protein [Microbacterium karelineae]